MSILTEIVDQYASLVARECVSMHVGPTFDACPRCELERALIAEARRARALQEYVSHAWDCKRSPCDCGLSALLRREDGRG